MRVSKAAAWLELKPIIVRWVPLTLFQSGGLVRSPIIVRVERLPLDAAKRSELRALADQPRQICLLLDPRTALSKGITIPRAAAALRENAVALSIRQTMPNQGRGLIWRSVATGYRDNQIDYTVFIIKEAVLEQLANDVRGLGVALERIELADTAAPAVWEARPGETWRIWLWMMIMAFGVCAVAIWSVVSMERTIAGLAEENRAGIARITALEERLVTLRTETAVGVEQQTAIETDLALFNTQSRRLGILTALTEVLPDTVWISELSITGDNVQMSGFATGDVAAVVGLLQAQNWTKSVRLDGPITYDSYGDQNRFDLGFVLTSPSSTSP